MRIAINYIIPDYYFTNDAPPPSSIIFQAERPVITKPSHLKFWHSICLPSAISINKKQH